MSVTEPVRQPDQTETKPRKPRLNPGQPPKITLEVALAVAELQCQGVPLRHACAMQEPPFKPEHFLARLEQESAIAYAYDRKIGECLQRDMALIDGAGGKDSPLPVGVCWKLERCWKEYYGQQRSPGLTVNVVTVAGVGEEVRARVKSYVDAEAGKVHNRNRKNRQQCHNADVQQIQDAQVSGLGQRGAAL